MDGCDFNIRYAHTAVDAEKLLQTSLSEGVEPFFGVFSLSPHENISILIVVCVCVCINILKLIHFHENVWEGVKVWMSQFFNAEVWFVHQTAQLRWRSTSSTLCVFHTYFYENDKCCAKCFQAAFLHIHFLSDISKQKQQKCCCWNHMFDSCFSDASTGVRTDHIWLIIKG